MPSVNGVTSPPIPGDAPATTSSATKRKRSTSDTHPQTNGVDHTDDSKGPEHILSRLRELLTNIHTVLKTFDTTPSILEHPLSETRPKSSADEPSSKRAKLAGTESIGRKLEEQQYSSLQALQQDVEQITSEMLKPLMEKDAATGVGALGARSRLSPAESHLWARILAFQKACQSMVKHESACVARTHTGVKEEPAHPITNGVKQELDDGTDPFMNGKKVLTLFAAAPQPKQLFSSFQQPVQVHEPGSEKTLDATFEVTMPLREGGLPHILSTTTIPQLPVIDSPDPKKARPTFGERFAPPRNLRSLDPPQLSKQTTTKGNTLEFVSSDDLVRRTRRGSYNWSGSPLTVGQWLGYGGVETPQEPTSPEAKRKQRDRALSTGEAHPPPSRTELQALELAKEEALFRKVYSSFAPTRDDSGAIVPEVVKNEMWWHKVGRQRAQRALLIDPDLPSFGEPTQPQLTEEQADEEEKSFEETVQNFDPEILRFDGESQTQEEQETDALLDDISELIETLYSYQLIRNMSVSKPQSRDAQEITRKNIGTPSTPSEAETEVYKTLRAQLMALVSTLPPYLLARLDGDRLKELNVSMNILVETNDEPGVLEEDQLSRLAKQPTISAATNTQPTTRPPSVSSYSNYATTATPYNRTPGAQTSVSRTPANYFPQQSSSRSAALPYQRTSSSGQAHAGSYSAGTSRAGYQQPQQQFAHSTARPGYSHSSSSYLQQLQQHAGSTRQTASQHYQTPQAAISNRSYSSQTPASNYQRPTSTAPMYNYPPQSPHQQRTASPLTPGATVGAPSSFGSHGRQPYATPGGQARSQYIPPGSQASQYMTPGAGAGGGFAPAVSMASANADQHSVIRAQLAAQAQARLAAAATANQATPAAAAAANRQGSGTPQPGAYPQGPSVNGTPMVAQRT